MTFPLFEQDLEKPGDEPELDDFVSTTKKSSGRLEQEIDAAAEALIAEEHRRQDAARKELVSYGIFLFAFMFVVLAWRDTGVNYAMRNALQVNILEEDFPLEAAHFQKNYFDIANGEEFFTYMKLVFVDQIGLADGGIVAGYNRIIGGIRLRQLRVGDGSCTVPSSYNKYPDLGCYAPWEKVGRNNNQPFGPDGRWKASEGNPMAKNVEGQLGSYPSGGFILDFKLDYNDFTMALKELEANEWIDQGTRVVFVEMLIYNLNVNMFQLTQIIVEFSAGGLAYPWVRFLPLQMQESEGFWTGNMVAIMQLVYAFYIMLFTMKFFAELQASRDATDPPSILNFFKSGWNVMDFLIISLAYVFAILLMLYQSDPTATQFNLSVGEYVDMFPVAEYAEMITQINAMACLLVFWKMLKYFNLSTRFAIMSNTLTGALPNIATFLLMFAIVFVAYAAMAMLLYGHALPQYSTFGRTMITLFLVTLGDFDYQELMTVTQTFTPVYFFSFIIIVFFVMLNMFIGIIAESYASENAKPKVSLGSEMASFLQSVKDGIVQPIEAAYKAGMEIGEKLRKEEEAFRKRIESAKKRAATGIAMADVFREAELLGLAAQVTTLWDVPINSFEDYTLEEKLQEYQIAINQTKAAISTIEEAGFDNGTQKFSVELEYMADLMRELNELVAGTEVAIKEANKLRKNDEDLTKEEGNPLLEPMEIEV